jgi:DNA polymerase-2
VENEYQGFIVHAYADRRRDRLCILGRLEDGRSFAVIETRWRPSLLIYENDLKRLPVLLSSHQYNTLPSTVESFEGREKLFELKFKTYSDRAAAASSLEKAGITGPDIDEKPQDAFLTWADIRGPVQIVQTEGKVRSGRLVDLVFLDPELSAPKGFSPLRVPLRLCSIDIETNVKTGTILALSLCVSPWNDIKNKHGSVRVLVPRDCPVKHQKGIIFHHDEKSLLQAFLKDIADADPDVLTGWNFLDFDYPRLAERCSEYRIPFILGRSPEEAKFFPAAGGSGAAGEKNPAEVSHLDRRYSAAALVPGRQVIDALRIVRSGPRRFPAYTLEVVAQTVLGVSKTVSSSGDKKIDDLENLYHDDPIAFGEYCKRDAELVLEILEKTGLFRLTLERASLTGVSLDKAWTSVKSFERVYGIELGARKIAPAPRIAHKVSGAAGGTVLEPLSGFFPNVGVFDFRSLYPTIMRTFNIDPLAHARAAHGRDLSEVDTRPISTVSVPVLDPIQAPNGAVFSREPGILPELISSYIEERRKALQAGDEEASFVYKILMNSFYGVLGTPSCRYGRTELAGAITSFARKWLYFSRDWFNAKGYKVLYGDTDSLFVESGLGDRTAYAGFLEWGNALSDELNRCLRETIEKEYCLQSHIELRFEKPYRCFMIPPLRNMAAGEGRGRAKGYGGWLLASTGKLSTEVKGMEAARSDSTPLARRIQMELLELVFKGGGEKELKAYVSTIIKELRRGLLDNELIYRKRLSRIPESYSSSTPPQVKAARALGWKNRRGTVEYVWTIAGPEPSSLPHGQLDYDHYAEAQVLSVARSIAAAAGWYTEIFPHSKRDYLGDGQMELEF